MIYLKYSGKNTILKTGKGKKQIKSRHENIGIN